MMRSTANRAGRLRRRATVLIAALALMASLAMIVTASSLATPTPVTLSSHTTLVQPAGGAGFKFFDTATLSASGEQPTGTVTFKAFGPIPWPFTYNATACSGTPTYEATDPVVESIATSQTFVPPPGDEKLYLFTASYSGDGNHEPATSECGAANESVMMPLVGFAAPGAPEALPSIPPTSPLPLSSTALPARVSGLRFSPSRFAIGRSTLLHFSLSVASPIEIVFARKVSGRQTVRGCVPASRPSRVPKRNRCVARHVVGIVTTAGKLGANHFAFDGHVGSRLLSAGTYMAQVRAAGVSSSVAGIEVVPRATKARH